MSFAFDTSQKQGDEQGQPRHWAVLTALAVAFRFASHIHSRHGKLPGDSQVQASPTVSLAPGPGRKHTTQEVPAGWETRTASLRLSPTIILTVDACPQIAATLFEGKEISGA